uniref:HTH psq-type domain-containing protein n=1 Tax=Heterorhabditis bacteriophora TaxID=37862 RepID=A0A1I7W9W2_HETBA
MAKALRTTIIHLHEQGGKNVAIAKKLCHQNDCSPDRQTIPRAWYKEDPRNKRSMRKMASDLGISPTSMRRISKHELSIVQQGRAANVLFTDEKIFTVNPACNSQNTRQLLRRGHQRSEKAPVNVELRWCSSKKVSKLPLDTTKAILLKEIPNSVYRQYTNDQLIDDCHDKCIDKDKVGIIKNRNKLHKKLLHLFHPNDIVSNDFLDSFDQVFDGNSNVTNKVGAEDYTSLILPKDSVQWANNLDTVISVGTTSRSKRATHFST